MALPELSLLKNESIKTCTYCVDGDTVYDLFGIRLRSARDFLGWGIALDFFEGW